MTNNIGFQTKALFIMKKYSYWGCELNSIEDMLFSKWLDKNPQIPKPNTLTAEQRKELLSNWLKEYRCKEKT